MSQLVNIWNYLSDTKELIGKSNAYDDAMPPNCTTVAPPDNIPDGKKVTFDEVTQTWDITDQVTPEPAMFFVYTFSLSTGELLGSGYVGKPFPAYCTETAPDAAPGAGSVLVYDKEQNAWLAREDHRGEVVYSTLTKEPLPVEHLGPLPENTTQLVPDVPFAVWNGSEWVTDQNALRLSIVRRNVKKYQRLMNRTARAICPLTTGRTLHTSEKNTLKALYLYADALSQFIQTADLTSSELIFPEPAAGLHEYPYSLNPTWEA